MFGLVEQLREAGPGNIRDVLIMQSILRVTLFRASYWSIDNRQLWELEHHTIPDDTYLAKGQRTRLRISEVSKRRGECRQGCTQMFFGFFCFLLFFPFIFFGGADLDLAVAAFCGFNF